MRYFIVLIGVFWSAVGSAAQTSALDNLIKPAYGLWSVGAVSRAPNYRGVDSEVSASLFVFGGYGPVFIEANRFGYNFYRDGTWFASAIGQIRNQNQRDKDTDLGLKERKSAVEAGAQIGRRLGHGYIARLAWLNDVSSKHKGHEFDLQLYRRDRLGDWTLLSLIALQRQSDDLVDHYYGSPGLSFATAYQASSLFVVELELIANYRLSEHFRAFVGTRSYRYEREIEDSPVADGRNIIQGFAGVGFQF